MRDLVREYPAADYFHKGDLAITMSDVYEHTDRQFVMAIDEWGAPMRERRDDEMGVTCLPRLPAGLAQGQAVHSVFLHDRNTAHKEIWSAFHTQHV